MSQTMKNLMALLVLTAVGCGDGDRPKSPQAAASAGEFAAGGGVLEAQASYELRNAGNAGPKVSGSVLNADGSPCSDPFEVILQPADGSTPTRVLYPNGIASFTLWPSPGDAAIRAHAVGGRVSPGTTLHIVPGSTTSGLELKLP